MTVRQLWFKGTIAVALGALVACAPMPGSGKGMFTGVSLPGGPLNQLPRATLRGLEQQVTWVGCVTARRTGKTIGTTTLVEICAAQYARTLGFGNTNGTGVLTARMVNRGSTFDKRWGLTPGDTSLIVSFPRSAALGSYAILEIPANTVPGTTVRVVKQDGNFIYCGHPQLPASSASFYTCDEKKANLSRQSRTSDAGSGPSSPDDALLQNLVGPAWVSCSAGCCTTEIQ